MGEGTLMFYKYKDLANVFVLKIIFIKFGSKLYRQIVGIPMGSYCAPLVADLFLFYYKRDFMLSLSDKIKLILFKLLTPPPDI